MIPVSVETAGYIPSIKYEISVPVAPQRIGEALVGKASFPYPSLPKTCPTPAAATAVADVSTEAYM